MRKIPLVNLSKQYSKIRKQINKSVTDVFESGQYIQSANVDLLERSIASYIGTKYAISCASGTDALCLALLACGVKKGDEVILPALSFFATAEVISRIGAKPVFVDIESGTYNIDCDQIEKKISKKTKVILPVHIYGQSAEMGKINRLAKKYKLKIVEDCCQSFGAEYKNKRTGSLGDVGCFSFFPTKNLGAYGDAGIITTDSLRIYKYIKALRQHGSSKAGLDALREMTLEEVVFDREPTKYDNFLIGFNSRMDEVQAAIVLVKLKYIDAWNKKRFQNACYYNKALSKIDGLVTPNITRKSQHIFHLYVLLSDDRERLMLKLQSKGIQTGVYYPVALHLQMALRHLGHKEGDFPQAELVCKNNFAIPVYPELTISEIKYIVKMVKLSLT